MQKLIFYTLALLLLASCATTKKTSGGTEELNIHKRDSLLGKTLLKNVSFDGYFIEKGRISSSGQEGRISLFFNMKCQAKGVYMISLRSFAGLEAFRVYIDKDTVLVNDRLNQVLLKGDPVDFEKITGLPFELLNIITGDFFPGKSLDEKSNGCRNGVTKYSGYLRGLLLDYEIDCNKSKVRSLKIGTGVGERNITLNYSGYRSMGKMVPRKVNIVDELRRVKITLKIEKISNPWFGEINFTPGKGYKVRGLR
ncbi:MAG: DUF4292 domain-containing protein [Bacteroidales bacterium]